LNEFPDGIDATMPLIDAADHRPAGMPAPDMSEA
jgi:hypothetical protein